MTASIRWFIAAASVSASPVSGSSHFSASMRHPVPASHAPNEETIGLELMSDPHRKRHRIGGAAEEINPYALPFEGT